jgi:hypothetical protein
VRDGYTFEEPKIWAKNHLGTIHKDDNKDISLSFVRNKRTIEVWIVYKGFRLDTPVTKLKTAKDVILFYQNFDSLFNHYIERVDTLLQIREQVTNTVIEKIKLKLTKFNNTRYDHNFPCSYPVKIDVPATMIKNGNRKEVLFADNFKDQDAKNMIKTIKGFESVEAKFNTILSEKNITRTYNTIPSLPFFRKIEVNAQSYDTAQSLNQVEQVYIYSDTTAIGSFYNTKEGIFIEIHLNTDNSLKFFKVYPNLKVSQWYYVKYYHSFEKLEKRIEFMINEFLWVEDRVII